jgi:CubicO group peptidase (beta-lactamase class C family)
MRFLGLLLAAMTAAAQVPSTFDNCPPVVQRSFRRWRTTYNRPAYSSRSRKPTENLTCAASLGYADRATQRPMSPVTLMRIASVSKTVTGMAIAKLFEDGKLGLEDPRHTAASSSPGSSR